MSRMSTHESDDTWLTGSELSDDGKLVVAVFTCGTFIFHSQWLYDARCDKGSSKDSADVFCQNPGDVIAKHVRSSGLGHSGVLHVTWNNEETTNYPIAWLRVIAPLVAQTHPAPDLTRRRIPGGWLTHELVIPEVSYNSILGGSLDHNSFMATRSMLLDLLVSNSNPGIIKITGIPEVDPSAEAGQTRNILTRILKRIFGSVFQHPRRDPDSTFKVATEYQNSARAIELPNYDIDKILLPHTDHAHYEDPIRIQGLHSIEGSSENTFINAFAALSTLHAECPDDYKALCDAPMIIGRVAQFYTPSLRQSTVDTAVQASPGLSQQIRSVRWHPHLTGYLLTQFDRFEESRRAHCKFQEIIRRDSHAVKKVLRPGDLYIWDNYRILHGRERIFDRPRLAVGQTVTEQVVCDLRRQISMDWLKDYVEESWLVQTPCDQLEEMVSLIKRDVGLI